MLREAWERAYRRRGGLQAARRILQTPECPLQHAKEGSGRKRRPPVHRRPTVTHYRCSVSVKARLPCCDLSIFPSRRFLVGCAPARTGPWAGEHGHPNSLFSCDAASGRKEELQGCSSQPSSRKHPAAEDNPASSHFGAMEGSEISERAAGMIARLVTPVKLEYCVTHEMVAAAAAAAQTAEAAEARPTTPFKSASAS